MTITVECPRCDTSIFIPVDSTHERDDNGDVNVTLTPDVSEVAHECAS